MIRIYELPLVVEKDDIPHVFESIAKAIDDLIEKEELLS